MQENRQPQPQSVANRTRYDTAGSGEVKRQQAVVASADAALYGAALSMRRWSVLITMEPCGSLWSQFGNAPMQQRQHSATFLDLLGSHRSAGTDLPPHAQQKMAKAPQRLCPALDLSLG